MSWTKKQIVKIDALKENVIGVYFTGNVYIELRKDSVQHWSTNDEIWILVESSDKVNTELASQSHVVMGGSLIESISNGTQVTRNETVISFGGLLMKVPTEFAIRHLDIEGSATNYWFVYLRKND